TDPLKLHYTWCVWRAGRSSFVGCASAHHRRGTPLPSGGRRKVYPIEDLNRLLEEFGRFAVPPALVSMAF
ncbi:MAG: hypothetical protein ACREIT_10205, partial [Tepidisphaeraceae bacterium]